MKDAKIDAILDTAETAIGKLQDEIEALKKERDAYFDRLQELRVELSKPTQLDEYNNKERRERIATAAMMGRLFSGGEGYKEVAHESIHYADALIKALEERP